VSGGSRAPGGGRGNCRSCGALIIWFKTSAGKNIPINAETVLPEDYTLELPRHISHFVTCPQAGEFRKKR
jgi:hypothetical protein